MRRSGRTCDVRSSRRPTTLREKETVVAIAQTSTMCGTSEAVVVDAVDVRAKMDVITMDVVTVQEENPMGGSRMELSSRGKNTRH